MQCNLTVCIFVSSSLFFLEVVVNVFDYFWKPNTLFANFCVDHLLMFYFVYCNNCALKDGNGSCWCTCSLVALRVPEICFWPAKTRKNLEIFEMHTCHWPGAQIWFTHKWRKLVRSSFLLHCIDWFYCLRYWNAFFSSCDLGSRLEFSIAFWRKRLQLDSKGDLATNGLILDFLLENGFFRWPIICMDWSLQKLLNSFLLTTSSSFNF